MAMVFLAVNPSRREASCCKELVMKGADGFRLRSLRFILLIR
jgi:hypothetical protein